MIDHSRTWCRECGETIVECRTLTARRRRDTVKETHVVDHATHLEMVAADVETRQEVAANG